MTKKIAVLPGDGIGTEIVEQAVKVLKALGEDFEYGCGRCRLRESRASAAA